MTTTDCARALGVSVDTIKRRIRDGRISATSKAGNYYVDIEEAARAFGITLPDPQLCAAQGNPLSFEQKPDFTDPFCE